MAIAVSTIAITENTSSFDALARLLPDPFFIAMALDHTQGGKTAHHRMPDKLEAWIRPRVLAPILSHEGEWGRWRVCGQDRQDG